MPSVTIFFGDTAIPVVVGREYIIEGYVYLDNDPINLPELTRMLLKPNNYSVADLDTFTQLTSSSPTEVWNKLTTRFTTNATEDIKIGLYQEYTDNGSIDGNIDSVTFKGPLDIFTEKKTIFYDSNCLYRNLPVKFLDSLGGYSYWVFKTYSDEGVRFGDNNRIRKNIFANWDNDFKNAQSQDTFTNSESFDTLTLRAENLTEQQAKDLFELVRSVRVYDNTDNNKPKLLLVDKNSVNITQGEKLYNLTFNARSTFINYRQRQ